MKNFFFAHLVSLLGLFAFSSSISGQELEGNVHLKWDAKKTAFYEFTGKKIEVLHFEDASYDLSQNTLPLKKHLIALPKGVNSFTVSIEAVQTTPLTPSLANGLNANQIPKEITPSHATTWIKKSPYAQFSFHPIIKGANGELLIINKYTYTITPQPDNAPRAKAQLQFTTTSVLASGKWGKVGVTKNGVYKLTYAQLVNLGVISGEINSDKLRVFGNGGSHLPFSNQEYRIDDLAENAISIVDGNDGVFQSGDYLIFYGEGPNQWEYDGTRFAHISHLYTDTNYYFVTSDYAIGNAKRIGNAPAISDPSDVQVDQFNDYQYHEIDLTNFVKSGRNWYGEPFNFTKDYSFSFSFPNIVPNTQEIKSRSAFRVIRRSSSLAYTINNNLVMTIEDLNGVGGGVYDSYANIRTNIANFNTASSNINVTVEFSNKSSSDEAWLDYIEILTNRYLNLTGNQMSFRNTASLNATTIAYTVNNSNAYVIWDVTDHLQPKRVTVNGNQFKSAGGQINEFIAVQAGAFLTPSIHGLVSNQNLHAIQQADYVIISHPNFLLQAQQLANHHRNVNGFNTIVITPQQIYNEFSSGAQDLTAIKTFLKMFYDRAQVNPEWMPKYVLLFGDASYDMKNRIQPNTNFIPSYQSANSYNPLDSYVTDDYIGLLDDFESDRLTDGVDVGIGRFVVQNTIHAQALVNKVIAYETSKNTLGAWHNWLTFVGDDEDTNIHMKQSEEVADSITNQYPDYNQTKIYLDAYPQVSNAGGSTYPEVNIAIDNATEKGCLIMNYIGHGGELGWAHERVLGLTQINNYQNFNRLPLFVTATCEFSRFDDPQRTSAGELLHLNPNGGAVGLLTTTRLVYSGPNFVLVKKFFNAVFKSDNGQRPAMGDVIMAAKLGESSVNGRNFTLLGDPAMTLRYPTYSVQTTTVADTIKSLQKVNVSGRIVDEQGQPVNGFNGTIYPTVFDKRMNRQTLNNDGHGIFDFTLQNSALFNGKVSVTGGEFSFEFIVPKDINFDYGFGKISYFGENGEITAAGNDQSFYIGGRDGDPNADQEGPTVNVYLNDESFITGGMTDQNPLLFATLFDENGINTVGNGIGHDITAIIDENTANPIILNEFYASDLNTYQSGKVSYNLSGLAEGKHTLRLKAWDVYNNSGEGTTEFYVTNSNEFTIDHVLNYPNPFTTNTDFYFEHNAIGQQLTIRVQIFTISGKLVKTIDQVQQSENYRSAPINWNGLDEYNDKLAKGTYIYRMKVTNSFGQTAEKFEKIVIL